MERVEIYSHWNIHIFWIWIFLTFLADTALASTTICGLSKCLIHHYGITHSIAPDQGTHFSAKEVHQWVYAHGMSSLETIGLER